MAARAMWKGVIELADARVPVKLYAAVEDRDVHFRLLHRDDGSPVRQVLVNPQTDEVVPYQEARRAFATDAAELVVLDDDELESVQPEPSRAIRISALLPQGAIDHRWYRRPYYLGPGDRADAAWFALIAALDEVGREGLAHWTMRNKEYAGALRLQNGYPMLTALHFADEVVPAEALGAPGGPALDERELGMARQLLEMYAAGFDPAEYEDRYRARVVELIEKKARGEKIAPAPARVRERTEDLVGALEASLKQGRKRA